MNPKAVSVLGNKHQAGGIGERHGTLCCKDCGIARTPVRCSMVSETGDPSQPDPPARRIKLDNAMLGAKMR